MQMGDRVILHSDINCCYASIEHLHHPELAGKPLAVGGDPEARHGIVLTADYIAKKYGVKTGMALWQAKQVCPDITFVSPRMDLYLRFSRMAHEIYAEYTDRQEPYGIDECWLDVTGSSSLKGDGLLIAQEISRRMKSELGITVSVGVSFNKIFAKLGSDYKKPDAITTMYKSEFKQKAWSLPVADLLYVGKSTNRKLALFGIKTIGDLARADEDVLNSHLGKMGSILWSFANGYDDSPVKLENTHAPIKSVGNSTTTPKDLVCDEDVKIVLYILAESVAARLRENGFRCRVVEISVRDNELFSFTRQKKIDHATNITGEIAAYEEMMTQVKEGNIQVIITKDYSRLGRDYLEVGRYLEFVFPVLKVRYISVNDNYDSNNFTGATGGMEVAVKNVINMMYSRDASKKVRSARTTLAKAGKFIGPQAPYGYKRSESDKQKLVIDEEPAEVVRLIFEMAIDGKKYKQIARYLNANNIDTRVQYKEKHGKKWNHPRNYEIKQWSATAVMNILFNEIYTGTIVYGKTACNAQTGYKSKKMNPDNWIIVENCHEPIVSKQTFEKAHKVINKTTCNRTKEQGSYKKSIIICGCCGKGLVNSYGYYKCSCDYDPSKYNCRNVRMKTEEFEAGVMQYINTTAAGMLEHLQIYKKKRSSSVELQKEIDKLHQMKSKAEAKKFQLYDDYTKGIVQRDIMVSERTTLTERIGEIEIELHELESKIQLEQCINKAGEEETIELLSKMETFDLDLIRQVVKRITMYDDGNIQFEWNVDDFLQVK